MEYKDIEFSSNKKEATITFQIPILDRQRGSKQETHGQNERW